MALGDCQITFGMWFCCGIVEQSTIVSFDKNLIIQLLSRHNWNKWQAVFVAFSLSPFCCRISSVAVRKLSSLHKLYPYEEDEQNVNIFSLCFVQVYTKYYSSLIISQSQITIFSFWLCFDFFSTLRAVHRRSKANIVISAMCHQHRIILINASSFLCWERIRVSSN